MPSYSLWLVMCLLYGVRARWRGFLSQSAMWTFDTCKSSGDAASYRKRSKNPRSTLLKCLCSVALNPMTEVLRDL